MKKISKNILFNIGLISFLFGVFIFNYFRNYNLIIFFISVFCILLYLIFLFFGKIKNYYIMIFLIFFFFSVGVFIANNHYLKIKNNINILSKKVDSTNHLLKIQIKDLYKIKEYNKIYVGKLLIIDNDNYSDKNINLLINIAKNYNLDNGDIIITRTKLREVKNFGNFDYKNFLLSKNIYFKINIFSLDKVLKDNRNNLLQKINNLRKKMLDIIYKIYPNQEALFLGGILLGARENLPKELSDNFNNSGLTHIIAVSGFNIAILIIFFSYLLKFIPPYIKVVLMIFIIIFFTFLVGFSMPVLRASIMGGLGYIIFIMGRKKENFTLILFVAFIIVLFSPLVINYDISFLLSFLAVLGILYTQNFWNKIFSIIPNILGIKESLILTMSAMSLTLPLIFFNFGQVSIISPFSNILVSWTIPLSMFFGFVSIIVYLINPFIAYIIGYFAWIFLSWDILIVNYFGQLKYSIISYDFSEISNYIEILYFLIVTFLILFFRRTEKNDILDISK